MMTQHNQYQDPEEACSVPVMAYPPLGCADSHKAPSPPVGYPSMEVSATSTHVATKTKGEGFWKGCVAALCCCWVLDFCC